MKSKILVAGIGSILAFAMVASAAGYTFSNYLSVGSTGADVTALQTWLIANGYSIPAIASGVAAKGYFGSQTKAAVVKYQASIGLPNTGFVGPLTIAKLNGGASAPVAMTCPVGFTCTPVAGTTVPPANTTPGSTISTPGIPGTLIPSMWTSPSNGTVVYKGQSYDVVAYKLQAAASDMALQSVSLDFDTRIWLYATAITLKDDQGNVVAQVSNLNSSNFSELTVGSDYRLTVPVSNYVIKSATTRYITANITLLATSDRSTGLIGITNAQFRSVDGTGVTDTESIAGTYVTTEVGGGVSIPLCAGSAICRYFSYQGSGAGSVVVTVDSSSPLSGLVQISTGGQTQNIPLAVYDIKVQNAPANLRAISFIVNTTGNKTPEQLFSQYSLKIGGQTFGANSITPTTPALANSASSTVSFTNFGAISLAADTYVPVTLMANVQQDTNNTLDGIMASTTLIVAGTNPDVEDQSYTVLAVNTGGFISSNLTFSGSSATLSNLSASLGSGIVTNNTTVGYGVSFSFAVTAGNNTLYIAADPATALGTTSTGGATSSLPFGGITANPSNLSGDSANPPAQNGYYVIPAGSSRAFTFAGSINNTNGTPGLKTFSITSVNYGTTTTALKGGTINYNLGTLKVTPTF